MNQLKNSKAFLAAAAAVLAAATTFGLGGCSTHHRAETAPTKLKPGDAGEEFLAPDEVSETSRLNDMQVAAGARTDSTLRAYHFRRGALNSLGRQKLDRIVAANQADMTDADGDGDDGDEMVIYRDASAGATANEEVAKRLSTARQDAVTDYLMSRGLTEDMFRIEMGSNPDDTFLANSAAGSQDGRDDAKNAFVKSAGESFGKQAANNLTPTTH
jgi:hypothetical protein